MVVEELEHGADLVASALQGVLDLVHGLLGGVPGENLTHVLEQVLDFIAALHH